MEFFEQPHRRFNPLTREWVLVSPHRTQRPWQGQIEPVAVSHLPAYDAGCYLCPGNGRAGGASNPHYEATFVFDNDFAALLPGTPDGRLEDGCLLLAESLSGICRVLCLSPRHDLTVARMDVHSIRGVVDVWAGQFAELGERPEIRYVQIFENRGEMMGCSNPHPHCQIWSTSVVPNEAAKESASQADYFAFNGSHLLIDYLDKELALESRIVCSNNHFVALVPFWAVWPFETILLPKRPIAGFAGLTGGERDSLAEILKRVATRYDNLFQTSFPYSMGFHCAPTDGEPHPGWVFHAHYYPPLLRSATVKKFMVGFEMLGMPQRDITPEAAAERLREQGDWHTFG